MTATDRPKGDVGTPEPVARRPQPRIGLPTTPRAGLVLALVAACVSGVAVFVNGYGVRRWADATAYTTAKNLVAALALAGALGLALARRGSPPAHGRLDHRARAGVVVLAVIGGSVPFVLFFEGLARASSTDAAFIHKTLVVWVALLAVPVLHERVGLLTVAAITLLVAGQAALAGGIPSLRLGSGELMILGATVLWAVETVVAKRVLTSVAPLPAGVARIGGGVVVLLAWLLLRGDLGALTGAGAGAWGWALLTGVILAAYVASWYGALARARAVDVTSVLVLAALVTAALDQGWASSVTPEPVGIVLIGAGGALVLGAAWLGRRPARTAPA